MDGFNFLFEAFILLVGLAMAEVLSGFARVLKLRARRKAGIDPAASAIRIGWLVPLLGLLVIIDQSTFFLHMYGLRDHLIFNAASVLGILFVIGWYYLVASLTFPDEPADWPDFDVWYWQQKRWVLGGVLGINIVSIVATQFIVPMAAQQKMVEGMSPGMMLANGVVLLLFFPALIWLMFTRRPRVNLALLVLLITVSVGFAVITAKLPTPG